MVNCPSCNKKGEDGMNGLLVCSVELTSRCNKHCYMCGRRKIENNYPELASWGDMDLDMVYHIIDQLPENIIVQFHNNGEPLLYPYLAHALKYASKQIRCFNTNGILLLEKADDIIDNMESLTISVIENDYTQDEQYEIVKKFLEIKGDRKPNMIYRLLGKDHKYIRLLPEAHRELLAKEKRWYELPGIVATRILHSPMGSFDYEKKVTIPEHGFCLDLLSHLVVNRLGLVSSCVRFDPYNELVIGDIKTTPLVNIWNGEKRMLMLRKHIEGKRKELPYCGKKCDYWGCPTSV